MLRKKQEKERLEMTGKVRYEYDSDEETEGGTWEHKRRLAEMEKTKEFAEQLTERGRGKHHLGYDNHCIYFCVIHTLILTLFL